MSINRDMTVAEWVGSLKDKSRVLHNVLFASNADYREKVALDELIEKVERHYESPVGSDSHAGMATVIAKPENPSTNKPDSLTGMPRVHAALEVLKQGQRAMTIRELTDRLHAAGFDMGGTAPIALNNSLVRMQTHGIVKKQKSNGRNVWVLVQSETAKEKLAKILEMPRVGNGHQAGRPTYGDIAYDVLKKANHQMHIDEILKAVNAAGLTPTRPTLSSVLLRDTKQRFKNLGNNTFVLTEWESEQADVA